MTIWALSAWLAVQVGAVAPSLPEGVTSLQDQTGVAVTAYNNGLALVRDTRRVAAPSGESLLRFKDVAQQIRPETVGLRSKSHPGSIAVLEQNFEYDLMSPNKLMEKYVGHDVKLVNQDKRIGFTEVGATLLSNNNGPIYKVGEKIYLGYPGKVVVPEIPNNLVAEPSLVWTISNTAPDQTLELTYLTGGVSWSADYVLKLSKDSDQMDVTSWVTLNNQSGASYREAQLKLVAGEVNLAPTATGYDINGDGVALGVMLERVAEKPKEESFGEYHLYTVPRNTTIKDNQSKQILLLEAGGVKCAKKYEYRGEESYYSQQMEPGEEEHVPVYLAFENREKNQLGLPLPGGTMRIYQADSDGMLQFVGEDNVKHTPKDEKVTLRMGDAFDVVATRVQKEYRQVADNVHESVFEITVRNHKDTDVVVDVVEPMPGDWRVLEKSQSFEKRDARTAVFSLSAPKNGEARVTYRVQVKY